MEKNTIQKIIKESFKKILLENETQLPFSTKDKINKLITKVLSGKIPNITLDNFYKIKNNDEVELKGKEIDVFKNFLNRLATIYQTLPDDKIQKKENIKNYILYSLLPNGKNSTFLFLFKNKVSKEKRDEFLFDLLLDAAFDGIITAIEVFDYKRGGKFLELAFVISKNKALNIFNKHYKYTEKGEEKQADLTFYGDFPEKDEQDDDTYFEERVPK